MRTLLRHAAVPLGYLVVASAYWGVPLLARGETTYLGEGTVFDSGQEEQARQEYRSILDEGLRRLSESGYTATGEVVVGESVTEMTKYARKINADLIVVGHKHLEGWAARWWRGSTSPALIERAHCSVLVVITH